MELCDDHRICYHKDPACGTLHLKIDNKDYLMLNFTERIELEILFTGFGLAQSTTTNPPKPGTEASGHEHMTHEPAQSPQSGHGVFQKQDSEISGDADEKPDPFEDSFALDNKLVVDLPLEDKQKLRSPSQRRKRLSKKDISFKNKNRPKEESVTHQGLNKDCVSKGEGNSTSIKQELSSRAMRYTKRKLNERKPDAKRATNSGPRVKKKVKKSTNINNEPKQQISKIVSQGSRGVQEVAQGKTSKCNSKWQAACDMSCQYCLKDFPNQQAFYDHKKTARSLLFPCVLCQRVFPFRAFLQAHVKACHSEKKGFTNLKESEACGCDVCGVEVKNMFALKKHLMSHTDEYFYKCCICGKQFVEPGTLNNHMVTHKSGGMIRCKCCDQLFATRGALAKHQLALMEVKCHLCGQTFPNRTSRTQHYKTSHQTDILKCVQCTCMFSSSEELAVHMKKHTIYKKKQCTTCGKFFSRLEKHIITHKSKSDIDEGDLFVCDKCPRKFSNRSSFQRHLSIHSQEKPYQCPSCPRTFADCGVLRKHLRRHSLLMPYQCEVCGKKCKESGNLKVHMRIHSDTKKFPCPTCPLAFNYKSSLDGHVRTQHSVAQHSAAQHSAAQHSKTQHSKTQHPETQHSGAQHSETQHYGAQHSETQRLGAHAVESDRGIKCDLQVPYQRLKLKTSEISCGQTYDGSGRVQLDSDHNLESRISVLEYKTEQHYASRQEVDFKQYYEHSADTMRITQTYSEGTVNPIKHVYNGHSVLKKAGDAPKGMYMGDTSNVASTSINLTSTYVNNHSTPIMSSQNQDELPMTAANISSVNVTLY